MYGLVVTHSYLQWEIICFALVAPITYCLKIMENGNNSGHILNEDHSPSFFKTLAREIGLKKKRPLEKSQRMLTELTSI